MSLQQQSAGRELCRAPIRRERKLQQLCPAMKRFECRAVLFDLDGVLVDSTRYVEEQWRHWATARGLEPEPFLRVCHGRRALETIQLAAPHLDAPAEIAAFAPEERPDAGIMSPIEGAVRLVHALPAEGWAVATSGTRATATARLAGAGIPVPPVLICAEDVVHGKPSPDVYLRAAEELRVHPSGCLVVEDAPAGISAARAAGMGVIALTTTHSPEELLADACTRSLAEVHLGRIDRNGRGELIMELLVLDR